MTQERRRYGFVLERQCSLAKHYLAYHSQGSTVLQRHLEDWQEVAQTREFLPDAVETMFNNRLRVSTVSCDGMSRWQLNVKNSHQLSPLSAAKFFSHLLFHSKGHTRIQVRSNHLSPQATYQLKFTCEIFTFGSSSSGTELPLMVESYGLLNDIFPFLSILDAGYPTFNLHLANVLFDVILPSVLWSSLWSFS